MSAHEQTTCKRRCAYASSHADEEEFWSCFESNMIASKMSAKELSLSLSHLFLMTSETL